MATYYAAWDTGKWDHYDSAHKAQVAAANNAGVYFGSDLELLRSYLSSGLTIDSWVKNNGGVPPSSVAATSGGGGGTPAPGSGFSDPSLGGGTMAGELGAGSMLDTGGSMSGGSGIMDFLGTQGGQALLQALLSFGSAKALGGKTTEERALSKTATAPFGSSVIQGFLPAPLRAGFTDPMLAQGLAKIAELLRNPGGLPSNVSDAIRPQLAEESATIAQNYRNLQSNAAGASARGNAPISIKNALSSALDVQQERAQRQARQEALSKTADLSRGDIGQTYNLLNSLLQFTSSGRGQAIPGLVAAANQSGTRQAANQALAASTINTIAKLFQNRNNDNQTSDTGTWF